MNVKLYSQLSAMMFLNYLIWGFWFVTIITFMTKTLAFSDGDAGLAFSTYAIASMISPFFVGMVADRFFSTEKLLGILHLVGAALMYALSVTSEFTPFFMLLLAYNLVFMPTIPLTNSLSFHHLSEDEKKRFPWIRVFGTGGWIVAGWVISGLGGEITALPLQIAAGLSVLMGIYCFTLPHTPPKGKDTHTGIREILGLDALALMKDRSFATVLISSFLICIPLAFYYAWTNVYLIEVGVENTARLQTFGQMSEVIFLILMPFLFLRLGMKTVMLIGMGSWVLRYVFFAMGADPMIFWMIFIGILLHGVCYDFFFVAGQMYVDKATPDKLKSSAQGLLTFATYGLGLYIGTWLSSQVVSSFQTEGGHYWAGVWYIPAALAAMVLIGFWMAFKPSS
ncbi:MAG: nucleoside permease [Bacteroidia bacterium]|nr:nucleoside permease [Bacteroidia bacterium]